MRKSRQLFVENLENRAMLAGNVAVSVSGDTLVITGDNNSNGVSVQQLDTRKFFVTGFSANGGNTTINGGAQGRIFTGINNISVDLNRGYDLFVMSNSAYRRDQLAQQLSGGTAGAIPASPQAANPNTTDKVTTRVLGDVTIATDEGNDGVGVGAFIGTRDANGNIVKGVLNVSGGSGNDKVIADRTQVVDDMLFDMGDGADSVHADAVRAGDFIFASLGSGGDRFDSNNAHGWHSQILGGSGNDTINVSQYRMEQETYLDGGSENDTITARGVGGGVIAIITGDGNDQVDVNGSNSRGGYTVDTGSGNDSVAIRNTWVAGHLGVFLGDGDDTLRVGNTTTGDTTFSGGSGNDSYFNEGGNNLRSLDKSGFEHNA